MPVKLALYVSLITCRETEAGLVVPLFVCVCLSDCVWRVCQSVSLRIKTEKQLGPLIRNWCN